MRSGRSRNYLGTRNQSFSQEVNCVIARIMHAFMLHTPIIVGRDLVPIQGTWHLGLSRCADDMV